MTTWFVDQSGKWEESGSTVIGISDTYTYSVLIKSNVKRHVWRYICNSMQERNRSNRAKRMRLFVYTLFLSLRGYLREGDKLVVDIEYAGHESNIRDFLVHLFKRFTKISIGQSNIQFALLGKDAMCHAVAIQTFRGYEKAEKELLMEDYVELVDRTAEIREKAFEKRKQRKKMGE
jgi:hypothetical protein